MVFYWSMIPCLASSYSFPLHFLTKINLRERTKQFYTLRKSRNSGLCISEIPYSSDSFRGQQIKYMKTKNNLYYHQCIHGIVLGYRSFNSIWLTLQQNPRPQSLFSSLKALWWLGDWLTKHGNFLRGFSGFLINLKTQLAI